MNILRNIQLTGADDRPFLLDFYIKQNGQRKPVIIFTHGFKGFKDYGCWDLVAKRFVEKGFAFVKYNFSHNGTTIEQPMAFADLEAFGNNNFTKELYDLGKVIDWVANGDVGVPINELSRRDVYLVGHSRGGAATLLKAIEDHRVKKLATWAGVSNLNRYIQDKEGVAVWKEKGVHYVQNSRTKQNMPLYYQLYEDIVANKDQFDIPNKLSETKAKGLIVHGIADETVPWQSALEITEANPNFEKLLIANMDHGLGGKQPWGEDYLPTQMKYVIDCCADFFIG